MKKSKKKTKKRAVIVKNKKMKNALIHLVSYLKAQIFQKKRKKMTRKKSLGQLSMKL